MNRYFALTDRTIFSRFQILATMALGLAMGHAAELAHAAIPKSNESVFYSMEFALNVALPYSVIALVPYFVMQSGIKAKSA